MQGSRVAEKSTSAGKEWLKRMITWVMVEVIVPWAPFDALGASYTMYWLS